MAGPTVWNRLGGAGVLPVVTLEDPEPAVALTRELRDAGLGCVEITFRTAAAPAAIERATTVEGACVGAGTVLRPDQARTAAAAGARFVVTPGTNPAVIEACQDLSLPVIPGVATPTEVERAIAFGCTVLKLFPAAVLGGPQLLRALAPVYPNVAFVPTGGITEANAGEYLGLANVLAVAGSWIAPSLPSSPEELRELALRARRAHELSVHARR
jgi:2-dehydro-3-deoxyphosphogluconate aldolase / (4S)-4-hydroxy-2-oxoglutarate aldolase